MMYQSCVSRGVWSMACALLRVMMKPQPSLCTRSYCMLGIVPSLHDTQYTANTCDIDALSHTRHTKLSIEGTFMSIFVCRMYWLFVGTPCPVGAVNWSSPASFSSPLTSGAATSTALPLAWPGPCTTCNSCRTLKAAVQGM